MKPNAVLTASYTETGAIVIVYTSLDQGSKIAVYDSSRVVAAINMFAMVYNDFDIDFDRWYGNVEGFGDFSPIVKADDCLTTSSLRTLPNPQRGFRNL